MSILRAGNGMLDGMLELLPAARVGHIGLYRDPETLEPVEYYFKVPDDIAERLVIVVDPMLATGNSAIAALNRLKEAGVTHAQVRLPARLAPEGMRALQAAHPDVPIVTAAIDERAQRARLHRARPGRCRRPDVRHALARREHNAGNGCHRPVFTPDRTAMQWTR